MKGHKSILAFDNMLENGRQYIHSECGKTWKSYNFTTLCFSAAPAYRDMMELVIDPPPRTRHNNQRPDTTRANIMLSVYFSVFWKRANVTLYYRVHAYTTITAINSYFVNFKFHFVQDSYSVYPWAQLLGNLSVCKDSGASFRVGQHTRDVCHRKGFGWEERAQMSSSWGHLLICSSREQLNSPCTCASGIG